MLARIPPLGFFAVSAVFHYLGPSFAVLLFERVEVLGVAWLRVATAGLVFALWRRPWERFARMDARSRRSIVALGVVLAAMNASFYLAIDRLPLATVGSIEFLGIVFLAALGTKTARNGAALALTAAGVAAMGTVRFEAAWLGFAFAFGNCALFVAYVIVGHRIANPTVRESEWSGGSSIDALALAMLVAVGVLTPIGFGKARAAFSDPSLLLAGFGVGITSSVVPYVTDQLAMARLPRATFALLLALLPVFAVVIGAIVLRQIPTTLEVLGIALVAGGVALHQAAPAPRIPLEAS